jgi:ERCC4 domain
MSVICKVDGKEFKDEKSLHLALRGYGLNKEKYYHTYYPRRDLLTGDVINFKSKDQYLNSDFNDKNNLKKWLKQQVIEKAQEYCRGLLVKRRNDKNLIYSPSQIELRTIMSPSIIFYNKIFDDYYELCSDIGLENKYIHPKNIFNQFKNKLNSKNTIYVDTREQNWLKFNIPFEIKTLPFGDYTANNDNCNCYIERKSLSDFISTLSVKNFDRFKNEIEKAHVNNSYLIVIVEEKLSNALSFQYLPHISKKIKATPEYIFHNVRQLIQEYDNLQFLFVDGRTEMKNSIEAILASNCFYKKVDLQLAYDMKLL